jgi:hypothetical protein
MVYKITSPNAAAASKSPTYVEGELSDSIVLALFRSREPKSTSCPTRAQPPPRALPMFPVPIIPIFMKSFYTLE